MIKVNPAQYAENSKKTVIVGMSGGVDSSVSALLLKEQGYKVIGIFMKNWDEEDEEGNCQATKDYEDVVSVCEHLEIPYYSLDFIEEYKERVFSDFLTELKQGHTPNPDILCNREIKFDAFFNKVLELGADYLATGHYCQKIKKDGVWHLRKGSDSNKDQSYFLNAIKGEVLEKVLFPIGGIEKSEVRELARNFNISTKDKKDSTGICFIGERNFKNFVSSYIQFTPGNFETLDGEVVGQHSGSCFYTRGQRKGLGLGGPGEPWYVLDKDLERNVVLVERGHYHPALYSDGLIANEISWINKNFVLKTPFRWKAKVRYRQEDQDCVITQKDGDKLWVEFDKPQRAITSRQSIVFYQGDVCLGGAMILSPFKSYFELNKKVQ